MFSFDSVEINHFPIGVAHILCASLELEQDQTYYPQGHHGIYIFELTAAPSDTIKQQETTHHHSIIRFVESTGELRNENI